MKKTLPITALLLCVNLLFASPAATNVMRELRLIYQTQKAGMFIDAYLRERRLNDAQIRGIRERIDFFFNSNMFIETGAAYLAHFFSERELTEIYGNLRHGQSPSAAVRRVEKLFRRLDPFIFDFLRQNVIPEPK